MDLLPGISVRLTQVFYMNFITCDIFACYNLFQGIFADTKEEILVCNDVVIDRKSYEEMLYLAKRRLKKCCLIRKHTH